MTPAPPRPDASGGFARLYRVVWTHAEGRRAQVVAFLTLLFAAAAIRLSIPWFFGQAVDKMQLSSGQDLRGAGLDVALAFGAVTAAWALHGPARVMERFTALLMRERFADQLYRAAVAQPMRWHESHHSGETIQRMNKALAALFGFAQHQFVYLQNAVSLVGPIFAICALSWATGAAAVLGYGLIGLILVRFDRVMVRLIAEENAADRRWQAELTDCLGNIATVLTLRLQSATRASVAARMAEVSAPVRGNIVVNEVKWCAIDLMNNGLRIGLVVLYAWLSWRQTGSVLLGTAVMIHQYSQQVGTVVASMAQHWTDLVRYQADIASADEVLDAPAPPPAEAMRLDHWREIGVENLNFAHAVSLKTRPTLTDVSVTLTRGGRVALVGESGSGKSTLMRVLAGLYRAERVNLRVDGKIASGLKDLAAIATLVPQDPEIFEATVLQNITMGIAYPEAEVARAMELSGFAPVLERLPAGLDTPISERGVTLSGGQKQRLALARGLLAARASSLVMLDEPTSSLDPVTEAMVTANLLAELPESCVVAAVHRLHLLAHFDRVVLMAQGKVVDSGTKDELLARQPLFRAMWQKALNAAGEPV